MAPCETERLLPYKGVIWEAGLAPGHAPPGGLLEPTGPFIRQDYGYAIFHASLCPCPWVVFSHTDWLVLVWPVEQQQI
jgi:hypothetical protein